MRPVTQRNGKVRESKGSVLVLTLMVGGLLVFFCIVAFCFFLLLSENKKGKARVEEMAVNLAKTLNDGDRVGQVNNVIARSRELVFLSRHCETQASIRKLENWEPLSHYLVNEARSGAELVEAERKHQIDVSRKAVRYFADYTNLRTSEKPVFKLPFWHTWDAEIDTITFGCTDDTQSNVENSAIYPELREYDEHCKYFQKGSNLYMGNINAKLPSPDNDLDFKLTALPAPVENTVAPARIITARAFKPSGVVYQHLKPTEAKFDQIPTAIEADDLVWITALSEHEQQMKITARAATTGGMPAPKSEIPQ